MTPSQIQLFARRLKGEALMWRDRAAEFTDPAIADSALRSAEHLDRWASALLTERPVASDRHSNGEHDE